MTDIYCYYHRHVRVEIIQRNGETYAICPECRKLISRACRGDLIHAWQEDSDPSDDVICKIINVTETDRKNIANAYYRH